jgi:hypothetical protein
MVLMVSLRIHVLKDKTLVDGFHLNVPEWRGDCPEKCTGAVRKRIREGT